MINNKITRLFIPYVEEKPEQEESIMVAIRRQWNDWKIAEINLEKLTGLHWDEISGGVQKRSPRPFIHGYCNCTDIVGEISHSCQHGDAPHHIKVCVVKKDNPKQVFEKVRERVKEMI